MADYVQLLHCLLALSLLSGTAGQSCSTWNLNTASCANTCPAGQRAQSGACANCSIPVTFYKDTEGNQTTCPSPCSTVCRDATLVISSACDTDHDIQCKRRDRTLAAVAIENEEFYVTDPIILNGPQHMCGGDLNGDGIPDAVFTTFVPNSQTGVLRIVLGSSATRSVTTANMKLVHTPASGVIYITGPTTGANYAVFGCSVGDFNGDGFGDLLFDSWKGGDNTNSKGGAVIVYGRNTSMWASVGAGQLNPLTAAVTDPTRYALITNLRYTPGTTVDTVTAFVDVNGDGLQDALISCPMCTNAGGSLQTGAVFVVYGRTSAIPLIGGLPLIQLTTTMSTGTGAIFGAGTGSNLFGTTLVNIRDFNGDGWADIMIGAPGSSELDTNAGLAYIVLCGINTTLLPTINTINRVDSRVIKIGYDNAIAPRVGGAVSPFAGVGDINADGFADVMVSPSAIGSTALPVIIRGFSNPMLAGVTIRVPGSFNTLLSLARQQAIANWVYSYIGSPLTSGLESANAWDSAAFAGDQNFDGIDDFVISDASLTAAGGTSLAGVFASGKAFVVYGNRLPATFSTLFRTNVLSYATVITGGYTDGSTPGPRLGRASFSADITGDGRREIFISNGESASVRMAVLYATLAINATNGVACQLYMPPDYVAGHINSIATAINNAMNNQPADVDGFVTVCINRTYYTSAMPLRTGDHSVAPTFLWGKRLRLWAGINSDGTYPTWFWQNQMANTALLTIANGYTVAIYGAQLREHAFTTGVIGLLAPTGNLLIYASTFLGGGGPAGSHSCIIMVSPGQLTLENVTFSQCGGTSTSLGAAIGLPSGCALTFNGGVRFVLNVAPRVVHIVTSTMTIRGTGNQFFDNPFGTQLSITTGSTLDIYGSLEIGNARITSANVVGYALNIQGAGIVATVRAGANVTISNITNALYGVIVLSSVNRFVSEYGSTITINNVQCTSTLVGCGLYSEFNTLVSIGGVLKIYLVTSPLPGIHIVSTTTTLFLSTSAVSISNSNTAVTGLGALVATGGGTLTVTGCLSITNNNALGGGNMGLAVDTTSVTFSNSSGQTSYCQSITRNTGFEVYITGATTFSFQSLFMSAGSDSFTKTAAPTMAITLAENQVLGDWTTSTTVFSTTLGVPAGSEAWLLDLPADRKDLCLSGSYFSTGGGCRPNCPANNFYKLSTQACTACSTPLGCATNQYVYSACPSSGALPTLSAFCRDCVAGSTWGCTGVAALTCSLCPSSQYVLVPCTVTTDTVCSPCPNYRTCNGVTAELSDFCSNTTNPLYVAGATNSINTAVVNAMNNQPVDTDGFVTVCVNKTYYTSAMPLRMGDYSISSSGWVNPSKKIRLWAGVDPDGTYGVWTWQNQLANTALLTIANGYTVAIYGAQLREHASTTGVVGLLAPTGNLLVYSSVFLGGGIPAGSHSCIIMVAPGQLTLTNVTFSQCGGTSTSLGAAISLPSGCALTFNGGVRFVFNVATRVVHIVTSTMTIRGTGNQFFDNPFGTQLSITTGSTLDIYGSLEIGNARITSASVVGYALNIQDAGTVATVRAGANVTISNITNALYGVIVSSTVNRFVSEYGSTITINNVQCTSGSANNACGFFTDSSLTIGGVLKMYQINGATPGLAAITSGSVNVFFLPSSAVSVSSCNFTGVGQGAVRFIGLGTVTVLGCLVISNNIATSGSMGLTMDTVTVAFSDMALQTSYCHSITSNTGSEIAATSSGVFSFRSAFLSNGSDTFVKSYAPAVTTALGANLVLGDWTSAMTVVATTTANLSWLTLAYNWMTSLQLTSLQLDVCVPGQMFDAGGCYPNNVCASGSYYQPVSRTCIACSVCGVGTYQSRCSWGTSVCSPCTVCPTSQRGSVCSASVDSVCTDCPFGFFCNGGPVATRCTVCNTSAYVVQACTAASNTVCGNCTLTRTFCNGTSATPCTVCDNTTQYTSSACTMSRDTTCTRCNGTCVLSGT